jgi:hypothetical protein
VKLPSRTILAVGSLVLCCCDPNVLIGYVPTHSNSAHDAAVAVGDVDAHVAADAAQKDGEVRADAAMRIDASAERDAGMPEPLPKVSWRSGVHSNNDLQSNLSFGTWRGRPIDLIHTYADRSQGWEGLVNPGWPVDMLSPFGGLLVLSVPLYPDGQGNNQDCAAGMYDAQWRKLGTFLSAHSRADTIIRLGWGPNDMNHGWRADADPSDWIACYRNAVSAIRATDSSVRIDWTFNPPGPPNITDSDPYTMYPGDAYVDFVGIEAFDHYPASATRADWTAHCNAPAGLCSVINFARKHGKKLGIAEWGVASCGGVSGGDNAFYVERVLATFAANLDVMGYEAYFEDDGTEVCSAISNAMTKNPSAAAMYKAIYSAR